MKKHPVATTLIGVIWLLSASGCSSLGDVAPANTQTITLESHPPAATVIADGAEIGVTPLTFNPSDAFRAGFTSGKSGLLAYQYVGKLVVKKPGCKDYVTEVDDSLLSKDIDVTLECDPDFRPPAAPAAIVPSAPAVTAPKPQISMPASAEDRLRRIDALHEKGLISNDEHRDLRQKVLDTL